MTIFFLSDLHMGHENFLKFVDETGDYVRRFSSVEEMDQRIEDGWNSVVRDGDRVYVLGDVTFDYGENFKKRWSRLRGSKRLVLGNHDDLKRGGSALLQCFKKIAVWRIFHEQEPGFVCSHVPIHPAHFRQSDFNVHGHIHERLVRLPDGSPDPRYINVCVEQLNYVPISMEKLLDRMRAISGAKPCAESIQQLAA